MSRIVVIEDETALRENIVDTLEAAGFDVYAAADGAPGVELVYAQQPDLVLCDIMMRGMDGYQVIQSVRNEPSTSMIPFIFITAKADRESLRYGMNLGADDYLSKPFTTTELISAIQTRLARQAPLKAKEEHLEYLKFQLSRVISHELRTPLTGIKLSMDLIQMQLNHLSAEELQDLLNNVQSGSARLSRLVEQMTYYSALELGAISREKVRSAGFKTRPWDLLVAAVNLGRSFAHKNKDLPIYLNTDHREVYLRADSNALRHALAEVIANALTYSPESGEVHVSQGSGGDGVWIAITDEGKGIPRDQLARMLDGFQQVEREVNEQQGAGLGLTLAHRLIEAHDGELHLTSTVGRGTEVRILLPAGE